jgi:hypothetical protein
MIGSRLQSFSGATPHALRAGMPGGEDSETCALMEVFQDCGGVVGGDAMAARLSRHWAQPVSVLARWIVERRVLHFYQHGLLVLPAFQFDSADGTVRATVTQVIGQLRSVLDDRELAQWFALPHALLQGGLPVRAIGCNASAVFEAARATHFARR